VRLKELGNGDELPAPVERLHDPNPATVGDIERLKEVLAEPVFMKNVNVRRMSSVNRSRREILSDESIPPHVKEIQLAQLDNTYTANEDKVYPHPRLGVSGGPPPSTTDRARVSELISTGIDTSDSDRIFSQESIVKNVPHTRKNETLQLLNTLGSDLRWTSSGQMVLNNEKIPHTNIKDLLKFVQTKRTKIFPQHLPTGSERLLKFIASKNLHHLVTKPNPLYEIGASDAWAQRSAKDYKQFGTPVSSKKRTPTYWRKGTPYDPNPMTPPRTPASRRSEARVQTPSVKERIAEKRKEKKITSKRVLKYVPVVSPVYKLRGGDVQPKQRISVTKPDKKKKKKKTGTPATLATPAKKRKKRLLSPQTPSGWIPA